MAFVGTTTTLGGNATFDSKAHEALDFDNIVGIVFSDQSGTVFIEQSVDGTNWDVSTSHAVTGGTGQAFNETLVGPYWRIRYTNGVTPQTAFRLTARTAGAGSYS